MCEPRHTYPIATSFHSDRARPGRSEQSVLSFSANRSSLLIGELLLGNLSETVVVVGKAQAGIRFNEHIEGDGPTFAHACKLGLEGIISKRKDSVYRSGRSPDWLKMKNPAAPAVTREAEED